MVKTLHLKGQIAHQCEACGLKYVEREKAEKCEAWCRKHNSCNLEITQSAFRLKPVDNRSNE